MLRIAQSAVKVLYDIDPVPQPQGTGISIPWQPPQGWGDRNLLTFGRVGGVCIVIEEEEK